MMIRSCCSLPPLYRVRTLPAPLLLRCLYANVLMDFFAYNTRLRAVSHDSAVLLLPEQLYYTTRDVAFATACLRYSFERVAQLCNLHAALPLYYRDITAGVDTR